MQNQKFILSFNFLCSDGIIIYKRKTYCTDLDSVIVSAIKFVKESGSKYGNCIYCDVVSKGVDIATIFFTKNNGRMSYEIREY